MNVTFGNGKENKCYEEFVNNPFDRTALRRFCRFYSKDIADEALNRHNLLCRFATAAQYNAVYGSTDNRIEKKQGVKDKDPFILKVRVTGSYRKFFHVISDVENKELLKTRDWIGQFNEVTDIFVLEVNKHNYNI